MADPGNGAVFRSSPDQNIVGIVIAHGLHVAQVAQVFQNQLISQIAAIHMQLQQFPCGGNGIQLPFPITGQRPQRGAVAISHLSQLTGLQVGRIQGSIIYGIHGTGGVVIGHIAGVRALGRTHGDALAGLHIIAVELARLRIAVEVAIVTVVVASNEVHRDIRQGLIGHALQVHLDHITVAAGAVVVIIGKEATGNLNRNHLASSRPVTAVRGNGGIACAHNGHHATVHRCNRLIAGGPGGLCQLCIPGDGIDLQLRRIAHAQLQIRVIQPNGGDLGGCRDLILCLVQGQKTHQLIVRLVRLASGGDVAEDRVSVSIAVSRVNGQKLRDIATGLAAEIRPVDFPIGNRHGLGIVGAQIGAGVVQEGDGLAVLTSDCLHSPGLSIHNKEVGAGVAVGIHHAFVRNGNVVQAECLVAVVFQHRQFAG